MEWRLFPGEWYLDAGALLLALALDLAFRELPGAVHPVVWMGRFVSWLERLGPSPGARWPALAWGGLIAVTVPCLFGGAAWVAANGLRELGPVPYLVGIALLLNTTFAVKGLAQAANGVRDAMDDGSMGDARHGLRSLVSRDANSLDQSLASAAAIESVAENTTDSYIGPWLAFAFLGLPGAFAYRAVNTLDSMVGYPRKVRIFGQGIGSARRPDQPRPGAPECRPDRGGRRSVPIACGTGTALAAGRPAVNGESQRRLDHRRNVRPAGRGPGEGGALPHRRRAERTCPTAHRRVRAGGAAGGRHRGTPCGGSPGPSGTGGGVSGVETGDRHKRPVHGGLNFAELESLGLRPEEVIDFSASINPLGPSRLALDAAQKVNMAAYPDPECAPGRRGWRRGIRVGSVGGC